MLPILRILPVGGVLLAILILVLALSPPDGSRSPLTATVAPARGALVDRDRHPEVRQFLILAALKRAKELNRLRELPDTPTRTENSQVAGLPTDRGDTDPDESGSINETPSVSIPVEIGEPSSTELPVPSREESTPALSKPERAKSQRETKRRTAHRARHTRVTANGTQAQQFNFFEVLFGGGQQYQQPTYSSQQAARPTDPAPYPNSRATPY